MASTRSSRPTTLSGRAPCLAAIVETLAALGAASRESRDALGEVEEPGPRLLRAKPDTAAYRNAVEWLLSGLVGSSAARVAATIKRRRDAFLAYRSGSLETRSRQRGVTRAGRA